MFTKHQLQPVLFRIVGDRIQAVKDRIAAHTVVFDQVRSDLEIKVIKVVSSATIDNVQSGLGIKVHHDGKVVVAWINIDVEQFGKILVSGRAEFTSCYAVVSTYRQSTRDLERLTACCIQNQLISIKTGQNCTRSKDSFEAIVDRLKELGTPFGNVVHCACCADTHRNQHGRPGTETQDYVRIEAEIAGKIKRAAV